MIVAHRTNRGGFERDNLWESGVLFRDRNVVSRFVNGGRFQKKLTPRESSRPSAEPVVLLRVDFRSGSGDLSQGIVDVDGFDVGGSSTGGSNPSGLGKEIEGSRIAVTGFS